jgi:electron transport complex protein RnfB
MTDVYHRLARRLDELPHGYPPTESGVEIRILKKIFSPDEAETALLLRPMPETSAVIAERMGVTVPEAEKKLIEMAEKGQIAVLDWPGQRCYAMAPYVVGIYEFQMYRIDRELAELMEEYVPTFHKTIGGFEPALARVVPVNTSIEAKGEVLVYEDVKKIIAGARSFHVHECICAKEQKLVGSDCSHPMEVCISFSMAEKSENDFSLGGRDIDREEAERILADAEKCGLVHSVFYNTSSGHFGMCNCCPNCCGMLRSIKQFGTPFLLGPSNYHARIDVDSCSGCGICAHERCPVGAIREEGDAFVVDEGRCIGCGVCAGSCPTESITLVPRPESQRTQPPENIISWYIERAKNRGIALKFD